MLTTLDHIPDGFLDASPGGLHQVVPGPTLIHLPGRKPQPLFVSVLLHGNEYAGLKAIQNVLGRYRTSELPRALSIFVGNVQAAAVGLRRLDGQPDYNRIWPGAEATADLAASPEYRMMPLPLARRLLPESFAGRPRVLAARVLPSMLDSKGPAA